MSGSKPGTGHGKNGKDDPKGKDSYSKIKGRGYGETKPSKPNGHGGSGGKGGGGGEGGKG